MVAILHEFTAVPARGPVVVPAGAPHGVPPTRGSVSRGIPG
jgi:hypothetical protein